ncbi:MAG: hypothetical protein IPM29_17715 [Planctomycetes bacterium]|nr:hypothetical protein [Planctomycetota bacterium]
MTTATPQRRTAAAWDGPLLALAFGLAWTALGQSTFHANDGPGFVYFLARDQLAHWLHFLYLPLLGACRDALAPLGIGAYRAAVLASTIGTALALLLVHAAARHGGMSRSRATLATCAAATCPGISFFATVVEVHGVFLAFAALTLVALAHWWRTPSLPRATLVGALSAVAVSVHASGHLLALLLAALAVARLAPTSWRRATGHGAVVLAAHAVLAMGLAAWLRPPSAGLGSQADFVASFRRSLTLADVPGTVWNEWLRAAGLVSVAWLTAARSRALRPVAAALAVALVAGLAISTLLIVDPALNSERGAYLLPLMLVAALLAARSLPRAALLVTVVTGAALSWHDIRAHDTWAVTPAARALGTIASELDAYVICIDNDEQRSLILVAPAVDTAGAFALTAQAYGAGATPAVLARVFDALYDRVVADGRILLLSERALALWESGPDPLSNAFVRDQLRARYLLTPVERDTHGAWIVARRG